ncbi:MAG TPA: hypothetical protein VK912_20305 [Longimicrobiales bacterium]|nr:hypothetical protein [Longimicrobiales bacterium]
MNTHSIRLLAWLVTLLALPVALRAQTDSVLSPRVGPPIQQITTASAVSTEALRTVSHVHELPDGRILVNDGAGRRLLLMDTTMAVQEVLLDSLSEIANAYGPRSGALLTYRADTVLFVDPGSYSMLVFDPQDRFVRIRSVWRVEDINYALIPSFGVPGIDARGRLVYRIAARPAPPAVPPPRDVPYFPPQPDSAFVVAFDLDTRMMDTLGTVRIPKQEYRIVQGAENRFSMQQIIYPLPVTDDWAVLPDGVVAFVRAQDYSIEYVDTRDGTVTRSAKLPFDWQRLTDDDKERMVDSVRVAQQTSVTTSFIASMIRWSNMYGQPYPRNFVVPEDFTLPPGLPKDWILPKGVGFPENYVFACAPGEQPAMPGAPVAPRAPGSERAEESPARPAGPSCIPMPPIVAGGVAPPPPQPRQIQVVEASQLPDYRPPLPVGATRADQDGNLWIRTNPMQPVRGGPIYDIVSRDGVLVNRIQLPPNYSLVGFGRDRVVYLSMRDATGTHVARVRLK